MTEGATLDIVGPEDIHNLRGVMVGTIRFSGIEDQLQFGFDQNGSNGNLQIYIDQGPMVKGRWEFSKNILRVNLSAVSSRPANSIQPAIISRLVEPVAFVHAPRESAGSPASAPDSKSGH